ncbi:GntR family transcriptional regulator [Falsiroseomonas sp. HW251]|uniref:GntR family transcriptional regulator n=1 Tax=Falsiroseomonas sp. HW251 TaxID=3390998 RepID=UPI003D319705
MARTRAARPSLVESAGVGGRPSSPPSQNRRNLFDLAYERIEEMIVTCALKPGRFLTMQELQESTGLGRTPVHQAVTRLAADTLIVVQPRQGLRIATIDLSRDRILLQLRRDLERFVIRLATERSGPSHRNQLLHLARALRERRDTISICEFNMFDRRIDRLIITAAGEPFLEHTLRPLHTIYRRIGWIHHTAIAADAGLTQTVDAHLAILDAVANRHEDAAMAATDRLIDFVGSMFEVMEREIDPSLLDCTLTFLPSV